MLESLNNNVFTYKKLTEEEQAKRGILGRLVGVIADSKNPTRNGRLYSLELWQNVFDDPIMEEKIANKCCFGELGHPADREEVDPEKIAICLAEKPKLNNEGQLCGVFDILATPCGKILKQLCDYGCTIGISSRGSGDVDLNDEVDPSTYFCECWDAVLIPAVKTARMQYVTEGLQKNKSLKQALVESINKAEDKDKKIMKEALDELNIDLEDCEKLPGGTPVDPDKIPALNEDIEEETEEIPVEEKAKDESEEVEQINIDKEDKEINDEVNEIETEIKDETPVAEEEKLEEVEEEEKSDEKATYDDLETVGELLDSLQDLDKKAKIEFAPIVIDGVEYPVNGLEYLVEEENNTVTFNLDIRPEMEVDIDKAVEGKVIVEPEADIDNPAEAEVVAEVEIPEEAQTEEAIDNGTDELVASLKDIVYQKEALEKEVKNLKDKKAVSDTKVEKLEEELQQYKNSFARISVIAAESKQTKKELQSLTEELNKKEVEIKKLQQRNVDVAQLNESVDVNNQKVRVLTEKLNLCKNELEVTNKKLSEQENSYKQALVKNANVAKVYKTKFTEAVDHYLNLKASMLGIKVTDIKNKLSENYSLKEIDEVCTKLLESSIPTFGFTRGARVKLAETTSNSLKKVDYNDPDNGYEIDEELLSLAGLK